MSKVNVAEDMKKLLMDVIDVDEVDLKPDAHFFKDLGVDSIKAIEIAVAIEKSFKVSIKDEDIPKITTLGEAVKAVEEALEK